MPKLDILSLSGEKVDEIELSDEVFGAPVREHLLWEVVVAQLAARRRGSASTKGRSDVRGSTRKLYRQKGTGRARHGDIKASIYVGGGTVFGPKPRSYRQRVSKKVRKGALRSALSLRVSEDRLLVVQDLDLPEIKTRRVARLLSDLGVGSGLIVEQRSNEALVKSARNLPHSKVLPPEGLNVYDILRYETLLTTATVAKQIEERLLR